MSTPELDIQWGDFLPLSPDDEIEERVMVIISLIIHLGVSFSDLF
jgi:hypothetical protein